MRKTKEVHRPVDEDSAEDAPTQFDALDKTERDRLERENESLREEKNRLQGDNRQLRFEKEQRARESRRLEDKLSQSRREEQSWRRAYVEGQRSRVQGDESRKVDSVRDAIDLARQMFPDRLLIQLNSRSAPDTSFENPEEVLHGLEWLATAYRARTTRFAGGGLSGLVLQAESGGDDHGKVPRLVPGPSQRQDLGVVEAYRQGSWSRPTPHRPHRLCLG